MPPYFMEMMGTNLEDETRSKPLRVRNNRDVRRLRIRLQIRLHNVEKQIARHGRRSHGHPNLPTVTQPYDSISALGSLMPIRNEPNVKRFASSSGD